MEQGTAPSREPGAGPKTLDLALMRETSDEVLPEDRMVLPRHSDLERITRILRAHLALLIPEVSALADVQPRGDAPAQVACYGVQEAEQRLDEIEGIGLLSAYRHAQRLARSVRALCDHYENLTTPAA